LPGFDGRLFAGTPVMVGARPNGEAGAFDGDNACANGLPADAGPFGANEPGIAAGPPTPPTESEPSGELLMATVASSLLKSSASSSVA
jgi:hypothetical protein